MALPDLWRHFLRLQILPNEDKADELRDEYLKCAARRGITDARVTVFKGLDKLCKAPEAIKGLAKTVSELGVSSKETVCKTCPLHDTSSGSRSPRTKGRV